MDEDLEAGLEEKPGHKDHVDHSDNDLSFRALEPVNVSIHSLTVDIDISPAGIAALSSALKRRKDAAATTRKRILDNVNVDMPSGSLTAILGGSGSGKTTMLHALSHRISGGRL
ncbi:MAG: hypothetical protein Q9212_004265 [Teloschistes hypoglaucus]